MRYYKRVGGTTPKFTHGKVYAVDDNGYVTNDRGEASKVACHLVDYWVEVSCLDLKLASVIESDIHGIPQPLKGTPAMKPTTQKLTVKTVTFVNGSDVNDLSQEALIALVVSEEEKKATLLALPESLRTGSKAVQSLIEAHERNIKWLVEQLDKTVVLD